MTEQLITEGVSISYGFETNFDGELAVFEEVGNVDKHKDSGFKYSGITDVVAQGFEDQLGSIFIRQSISYSLFGIFTILYDAE